LRNTFAFEGSWDKALRDRMRCLQYLCANRIVSNFDVCEEPLVFRWLYKNKQGIKILNGIDLHALERVEAKSLQKQAEFRVIYAGRLVPQKNLLFALDVLSCLINKGLDAHLTLFGAGPDPYVSELRSRVSALGIEDNVTFYGGCSNWHSFAKDATALLFPTNGEGTSNTVLEALAIGLPVVMSNIQMSRALLRDRENAIVVDSDSTEVWAQRLVELFSDRALRARIQRAGKALAQECNLGKMVDAYDSIYQAMLNAKQ
jgi:glycosyltransferase involved in cell wall biosynthesis